MVLAAAVFTWQVYRAAITAVTPREAVLFTEFASKPLATIVASPFHPSNQILHTLLVARFVRTFRLTEFTLRMASLFGFLLYLWASFRIAAGQKWGWLALILCLVNPFTLALPSESTGVWMASALFLLALENLTGTKMTKSELSKAALQLGLAICFDISFAIPIAFVTLYILLESGKTLQLLRDLILPIALISLSLLTLTLLKSDPGIWRRFALIELDWTVLSPVIIAAGLVRASSWKRIAFLGFALAGTWVLSLSNGIISPFRFHSGPESGLPRASRALRDEIRRHDFRVVTVAVSDNLDSSFDFYRRRYALGATKKVSDPASADYWVASDADPRFKANAEVTRLFQRQGISVFRRD